MRRNPVDFALQHVVETRNLLETLLTSSESFDYLAAKKALARLRKKTRELGKFQAKLQDQRRLVEPNIEVVHFRRTTLKALHKPR
jgi:hypothetical protein